MKLAAVVNRVGACSSRAPIVGICIVLFWVGRVASAQAPTSDPSAQNAMTDAPADQNKQLTDQITDLRAQVARLQAAVQQTGHARKVSSKSGMKMTPSADKGMGMGMDDKSEMGMPPMKAAMTPGAQPSGMKDDGGGTGGSPMGGTSTSSSAPDPAMGMCCMGKKASGGKPGMSVMPMAASAPGTGSTYSAAMPGQANGSNVYHIGSNGFFLNQSQRITLTPDQKLTLNHLKDKALLDRVFEQGKIKEAEQELFTLTGAAQPDNAGIQEKIREIEKLRADGRINFIRAVGDASKVLTPEQHKTLLGM